MKSKSSPISSVRVDPSLATPAPPLLNASMTITAGASDADREASSWTFHCTRIWLSAFLPKTLWTEVRTWCSVEARLKARSVRLKSPTPRLRRSFSLRRYSNRSVWLVVRPCSRPTVTLVCSKGRFTWSAIRASGRSATMVVESNDRLPSTVKRSEVRLPTMGPRRPTVKRRNCSGVSVRAKAFRAFSTSLRSPTLALPLHSVSPGRVMMSTCTRPASWLSAENELVRKRIWRISSRFGSRPPRKPFTLKTAPAPPVIASSWARSSSGSSDSSAISSSSSVVVSALPRVSPAAGPVTTISSCTPAMKSVTVWLLAPRRSVTVAEKGPNPLASTCSTTGPSGNAASVVWPRSSTSASRMSPAAVATRTCAVGIDAPVWSITVTRNCAFVPCAAPGAAASRTARTATMTGRVVTS
ncbi:MAG: hypothetical protein A3I61_07840 [Acidobacteria bacterium RIFCSPLOWO2_02_FULL_68_18]|nr:MAG: hypothetical protein A3I61_07840 [Acidobacteria bacterium RIFCSPLOWO2_02_FULL_68_18]